MTGDAGSSSGEGGEGEGTWEDCEKDLVSNMMTGFRTKFNKLTEEKKRLQKGNDKLKEENWKLQDKLKRLEGKDDATKKLEEKVESLEKENLDLKDKLKEGTVQRGKALELIAQAESALGGREQAHPTPRKQRMKTSLVPQGGPKRPAYSFLFFCKDERGKAALTGKKLTLRVLGKMWAEADYKWKKERYQKEAREDRNRYIKELAAFKKRMGLSSSSNPDGEEDKPESVDLAAEADNIAILPSIRRVDWPVKEEYKCDDDDLDHSE